MNAIAKFKRKHTFMQYMVQHWKYISITGIVHFTSWQYPERSSRIDTKTKKTTRMRKKKAMPNEQFQALRREEPDYAMATLVGGKNG